MSIELTEQVRETIRSAAQKLTRFNEQIGMTTDWEQYPTTAEREQFTRAIVDLLRHRELRP